MIDDRVVPKFEYCPERTYLRIGTSIECYTIIADNGSIVDRQLILENSPLFTLELPSETLAKQLMEDLYYGEYTGG